MFEDVDPENASLEDFEPLRVYLTDVANEVCETEMKVGTLSPKFFSDNVCTLQLCVYITIVKHKLITTGIFIIIWRKLFQNLH